MQLPWATAYGWPFGGAGQYPGNHAVDYQHGDSGRVQLGRRAGRRASACCLPSRAATARAWTAPSKPSSGRWRSTARRSTSATRSCTTSTWSRRWPRRARSSSTRPTRCPRASIVVFSAHGVAPTVHVEAAERNLQVIDATCPLVTKVHNEAKRFARDDYDILLDRPRGPRRGRRHRRRGARPRAARRRPGRRSTTSPSATRTRSSGCRRPR